MFGWVKKAASFVWGGMKTVVKKGCELVKEGGKAVWKGMKKVGAVVKAGWEIYTGRNKEREAEALLAAMEEKARSKEKEYSIFFDKIQQRIDSAIKNMNELREELNLRDFRRFEELASNFSTWEVGNVRLEKNGNLKKAELESLQTRGELFKIDFRNHPVKSNLKAIVSFGIWSRKRAKETLHAVLEEKHRFECDLKKFEAEKVRLDLIAESLEKVVIFMSDFRRYYNRIIDELDYSVNFLRSSYFAQTQTAAPAQMDPAMLPERHQKCLECADKATRILFEIGKRCYVKITEMSVAAIDVDFHSFDRNKAELDKMQNAFAA